jgi:hypothetical protein
LLSVELEQLSLFTPVDEQRWEDARLVNEKRMDVAGANDDSQQARLAAL